MRKNSAQQQLFGGLVPVLDSEAGEEEEDIQGPPRKRSRSHKGDDRRDNDVEQKVPKKQRGRPKVTTKDETAAERRRTQIRLAQRAYRNRKENTITDLTQKVESLQTTIKDLNQGFLRLRESLLSTGLIHGNSVMARQMDDLMQKLNDALEKDNPSSDAEKMTEEEDAGVESHNMGFNSRTHHDIFGGDAGPSSLQGQAFPGSLGSVINNQSDLLDFGADHSMLDLIGHNLTDIQNQKASPTNSHTYFDFMVRVPQTTDTQITKHDPRTATTIERFPHKQAYTYSFQETTFARRLQRYTLERAFRKIMSPNVDADWLLRSFRFTLHFTNRERMITAFKAILSRGTDESLENWKTPFVHIGGAGLHFPRRDLDGKPVYPPNLMDPARAAAPWRLPKTEFAASASETIEEILERIGFGGEWFDSHDVEEYLKTKGIYPDPTSSFVMIDSALLDPPQPSSMPSAASTVTSASSPRWSDAGGKSQPQDLSQPRILDTDTGIGSERVEPHELVDDWLDQNSLLYGEKFNMDFNEPVVAAPAKPSRMLTIEIETLLHRLAEESVCLGRAPGFRREVVDNALAVSIQEAF